MFLKFLKDTTGATAVEYGLIAAVLSLAIIGGVGYLANDLQAMWGNNDSEINQALSGN